MITSSNLGIGIAITLRDQVTHNLNRVTQSMNGFYQRLTNNNLTHFQQIRDLGLALGAASYGAVRAMSASVDAAAELETQLLSIKAIITSDKEKSYFGNLKQDFIELSRILPYNAAKIAEMGVNLKKAGVEAQMIPEVARAMGMGAVAYGERVGGPEGFEAMALRIMAGMKIPFSETPKAVAQLGRASVEAIGSPKDIFESFKYSQDILKGLHFKYEEMLAAIVVLNNVGIPSSVGGIALANMFRELSKAVTDVKGKKVQVLQALGLTPRDFTQANGNLVSMLDVITKLKKGLSGYSGTAQVRMLYDLFGARGSRGANPLMDALFDNTGKKGDMKTFQELLTLITKTGENDLNQAFETKMQSYNNQVELLKNALYELKVTVGEALIPVLRGAVKIAKPLLSFAAWVADNHFGKSLIYVVGAAVALSAAFAGLAISTWGLNQAMGMITGRGPMGGGGGFGFGGSGGGGGRGNVNGPVSPYYGPTMFGMVSRISQREAVARYGVRMNAAGNPIFPAGSTWANGNPITNRGGFLQTQPAILPDGTRVMPNTLAGNANAALAGSFTKLVGSAMVLTGVFQSLAQVLGGENAKEKAMGYGGLIGTVLGGVIGAFTPAGPVIGAMVGSQLGTSVGGLYGISASERDAEESGPSNYVPIYNSYSQKNKDRYMNSIGGGVPANVNVTVNVDGREAVTKQLNAFAEKNLVHHYNIETN